MGKKVQETPVKRLLRCVWNNACSATDHAWERVNHSMRAALTLAIGAGLPFTRDDFQLSEFRSHYWIGDSDEWCYSLAVSTGNLSAAKAFEELKGRAPLIADNVTPIDNSFSHLTSDRASERLHVGCQFTWQGERVEVTSFNAAGAAIACAYEKSQDGWGKKVRRRVFIRRTRPTRMSRTKSTCTHCS